MRRSVAGATIAGLLGVLLLAAPAEAGPRYRLEVKGLTCPFCAYGIEKSLRALPGVSEITTHIRDGVVELAAADGQSLTEEQVRKAVERAGFTLRDFARLDASGDGG